MVLTSHANRYLPDWVAPLALGNVGVFAFFALSGFVIAEACDRFYPGAPQRFLLNRLLRIYPTYWLVCLVALAIYVPLGHPELRLDPASVAANLSILIAPEGGFVWISLIWAVGIELRFYFVAALMELARMLLRRPRLVHILFWFGALAFYLATMALDYQRLATFRHAPYFMLGMSLYHVVAARTALAGLATLASLPFVFHAYWTYNAAGPADLIASTLVFGATLAAMAALAFATVSARAARIDKLLGDLTYPLYLVHWPIVWLVAWALPGAGLGGYAAVALASLAASGLVLAMEQPLARLRDRVRGRRLYA